MLSLKPVTPLRTVHGKPNIGASNGQTKEHEFEEEPAPTTALALLSLGTRVLAPAVVLLLGLTSLTTRAVQVLGLNLDDVVVVREFSSLCRETKVSDGGKLDVGDLEAAGPFVFFLEHQIDLQGLVLKVGDLGFGRESCVT